ncbi:MAG: permease [Proteobacteria bacterium]|nr:permease [Pseudomonadota bacterium]
MTPLAPLVLASLGLIVGPLCGSLGARSRPVHALVDGFALALVGGLCLVFVLPHAVGELGILALALAGAGVALPSVGQRFWRSRSWSLAFVVLSLLAHVVLDGMVLATQSDGAPLAWAVVAHRLPVGFAVVVTTQAARRSAAVSWGLTLMMVAATVVGYAWGASIAAWLPHNTPGAWEALVAGVLLHVVFLPHVMERASHAPGRAAARDAAHEQDGCGHGRSDRHHHDEQPDPSGGACSDPARSIAPRPGEGHTVDSARAAPWAAAGTLAGLVVVFAGGTLVGPHPPEGSVVAFLRTFCVLVLESAPALLLGYGLAGALPYLLTPARTSSLARGGGLRQSLRGVAFGLPIPVCSCGVLPLYQSLVRRGAPPIAAMAFFVATPEIGLDAVLLSVPLLGSSLTLARVLSAFAVALLVALLVGSRTLTRTLPGEEPAPDSGTSSWSARMRAGMRFGFVEVFDHTMPWIALGLIVAAMAEPMLSHSAIETIPRALQVPIAALVGVPVYVCASGATPVAALALHKGLSSGAAIAFLIAGPATNVTTFGVLASLHGRRIALLFGFSVTALAVLAGWLVDVIGIPAAPVLEAHADAEAHGSWFAWICVGSLAALAVASLFRQGPRGALRQVLEPIHAN